MKPYMKPHEAGWNAEEYGELPTPVDENAIQSASRSAVRRLWLFSSVSLFALTMFAVPLEINPATSLPSVSAAFAHGGDDGGEGGDGGDSSGSGDGGDSSGSGSDGDDSSGSGSDGDDSSGSGSGEGGESGTEGSEGGEAGHHGGEGGEEGAEGRFESEIGETEVEARVEVTVNLDGSTTVEVKVEVETPDPADLPDPGFVDDKVADAVDAALTAAGLTPADVTAVDIEIEPATVDGNEIEAETKTTFSDTGTVDAMTEGELNAAANTLGTEVTPGP